MVLKFYMSAFFKEGEEFDFELMAEKWKIKVFFKISINSKELMYSPTIIYLG